MQPVFENRMDSVERGPKNGLSARGQLTAAMVELAAVHENESFDLRKVRDLLEEVLAIDSRFPFHLAAFLREKMGGTRVSVALLVEATNRVAGSRRRSGRSAVLPFSLRPIVHRVVRQSADAAYAMAYQVRHFGWAMPTPLRVALTEVLSRDEAAVREPSEEADVPLPRGGARALQPLPVSA